ncbi:MULTISPECIES: inward rectifier potassium channel [unclassified Prochlorococcus]|uniref:inward rectifier potassium channel n=1 Tax=unclassified Prochlorococcus TaxID=2627481 RepID=UPI000533A636|nr:MULTISPECIES: inward rectifier potassium channel [unclassified Prochlorococcus]KGG16096.1 putative Inward rectifier potassium channel [Prochlorococcus sp. MIT 0602]KGG17215.1 putative Inward rectifier potassium channel [Prochlorococcus sp. MIT 0603]
MTLELTDLVKDFVATELLSKVELDFLEAELWETFQHIGELTSLSMAPSNISKRLDLADGASWSLCCAAVLDVARPLDDSRVNKLSNLIKEHSIQ